MRENFMAAHSDRPELLGKFRKEDGTETKQQGL
jgi:hypothetical protein